MIKLTAPDGYSLKDTKTGRIYSEVVTDEKNRNRYVLVPEQGKPVDIEINR